MMTDDTKTEAEGDMTNENDNIDNEKDDNENREKTGNKTKGSNEIKSIQCYNKPHDTYTVYDRETWTLKLTE